MDRYGYWVKDNQRIDVTVSSHVRAVMSDPEQFGLTSDFIKKTYAAFSEPLGFEGKARAIILKEAM